MLFFKTDSYLCVYDHFLVYIQVIPDAQILCHSLLNSCQCATNRVIKLYYHIGINCMTTLLRILQYHKQNNHFNMHEIHKLAFVNTIEGVCE